MSAFLLAGMLCGCSTATQPTDSIVEHQWRVGFGCVEIIPDGYDAQTDSFNKTYYVAGYKNDNPATSILDAQCVRAVYISDGETKIILVSVDCVGMSRTDIGRIRAAVSDTVENCGIDALHIASTHTHAGIDTLGLWGPIGINGKDDAFMEKVVSCASASIRFACMSAREGKLYYGTAETENMQRDSRLPEVYSRELRQIRFAADDGAEGVRIIGYDAHAEALRSENTKVSADYPFYMASKIKAETGDDVIFFAGAVGGLIMTERIKDESGNEYPVEQNVVITGEKLADYALAIENERPLEPIITDKTQAFQIELDNDLYVMMAFLGVLSHKPVTNGGPHSLALESSVSVIRLGDLNIAAVPGEIFPELVYGGEYGQARGGENPDSLCKIFGDDGLFVIGLCDDEIGYIVSPSDYYLDPDSPYLAEGRDREGRKHYEETNSVSVSAAEKIAEAFTELLK